MSAPVRAGIVNRVAGTRKIDAKPAYPLGRFVGSVPPRSAPVARVGPSPGGGGPGTAGSQEPLLRQFVTQRVVSIQQQLDGQREGYVPVQMNRRGGPGANGPAPGGPGRDLQPLPPPLRN